MMLLQLKVQLDYACLCLYPQCAQTLDHRRHLGAALTSDLDISIGRSTGEYLVSFEVWHKKLIQDAERFFEQKVQEAAVTSQAAE